MMDKTYAIYIPAEGKPEIIEFKGQNQNLDWYYEKIGCEWIELVRTPFDKKRLVIDEEGLLKENPKTNMIASILYGAAVHGQALVGNAILCDTKLTFEGEDLTGMTEDAAIMIMKQLEAINEVLGVF